jgi:hypothetical protein
MTCTTAAAGATESKAARGASGARARTGRGSDRVGLRVQGLAGVGGDNWCEEAHRVNG